MLAGYSRFLIVLHREKFTKIMAIKPLIQYFFSKTTYSHSRHTSNDTNLEQRPITV